MLAIVLVLPLKAQFGGLHPDVWLRADRFDYKNKVWKDLSGNSRRNHGGYNEGHITNPYILPITQ